MNNVRFVDSVDTNMSNTSVRRRFLKRSCGTFHSHRNCGGCTCWERRLQTWEGIKDKHHNDNNALRHSADSESWKDFDKQHNCFIKDPRNVRLGLANDVFNPFGNMSIAYIVWPVVLMPYNLPPWKCMKEPYFMMSLIILGSRSPGRDIYLYLQHLIDESKELWQDGGKTCDASKKQIFRLDVAVLWTINNFPAYEYLSEWSTKGKMACPTFNKETSF